MSSQDERWQGFDENGEPNELGYTRTEAYAGALHGASHVWIWRTRDGVIEVLLQFRALSKRTWPGLWDISAAGHIDLGETSLIAACRETSEEIGLDIMPADLKMLFVFRTVLRAEGTNDVENEFQFVYGYNATDEFTMALQQDEVSDMCWVSMEDFNRIIAGTDPDGRKIVPHPQEYFSCLTKEIKRLTKV